MSDRVTEPSGRISPRGSALGFNLLYGLSMVALGALMLHTVVNAIVRSTTGRPVTDTTEMVAGWYMPVAILVAIFISYQANEHTRAGLVFGQLGDRAKRVLLIVATLIQLVLVGGIAAASVPEALRSFQIDEHFGISSVAIWPIKWLIPVTFFLMFLVLIKRLVENFRSDAVQRDAGEHLESPDI